MNQSRISQALSNLDEWIQTWTDNEGGVHGYVVHHHQDCFTFIIPDTWTQSPILMAHITLYEKTGEIKWLNKATLEAKYLSKHYIKELHAYHASGHESKHKSDPPLIGNAFPTLALLNFVAKIENEQKNLYNFALEISTDNIDNFILKRQWDAKNRTFFAHFAPTKGTGRPHVHNMTSIAISALIAYARVTGKSEYVEEYAIPAGEHILSYQDLTGDISFGGYPYNDGRSSDLYHTIYHAITMRGIIDLYEYTKDIEFLKSANIAAKYLINHIDDETHLFIHRIQKKKVVRYPQWIAGSGVIIHQIKRLESHGYHYNLNRTFDSLLKRQHPHGGFPTFLGFEDLFSPKLFPAEPMKNKWRDVIATPNWNGFIFELLSFLLEKGTIIPEPTCKFPLELRSEEGKNSPAYTIYESKDLVRFIHPKTNDIEFQLQKTDDVPQFGIIKGIRQFVRQEYRIQLYRKIIKYLSLVLGLIILIEAILLIFLR